MAAAVSAILIATGGTALSAGAALAVNVAAYAATTAVSYFLQQSMVPKEEIGTKLKSVMGDAVNLAIIFATKESAGSFIYRNSWGVSGRTPNGYIVKVYCLSDLPCAQLTSRLWAGGKKCTIDLGTNVTKDGKAIGHPVPAFQQGGDDYLWVKFLDGTQTSADTYLRSAFGSDANRPWTVNMIGRGRTLAIVTQRYNKKEPAGEVDCVFVPDGAKFYDWRKDSTNGGSGTHRYGTYSTYEALGENPFVTSMNVMRGIYYGSEWMYGGEGWPARRFDNDTWTAAANVCDENAALAAGGTEKRYRAGGEINLSEEPWSVIERLFKAANGRLVESGGIYKAYAGGIGASIASITDDDVIVSEPLSGKEFPSANDIANTIVGTYVEPDNAGEATGYKSRTLQAYIDEDGGHLRRKPLDFEYVRSNTRAQRIAKLALNDNRRFRSKVVVFASWARKLEPCDVITWTSTRWSYTAKKFIVGDVTLRHDGLVEVILREADANDANWSTGDEDAYEVGVYGDIDAPTQTLTATVTAAAITDDDNTTARAPAVRIQATLDDDFVDCKALLYQVRKRNGDHKIIARGRSEGFFEPANADYGDITFTSAAFKAGKEVQVRYRIEPESDRETAWSDDWSTTTNYITLSSTARLKIETSSDDNDIDMVVTDNVTPNTIWNKGSFDYSKSQIIISGGGGDKESDSNIGDIVISNPNKTPVFINFEYDIEAITTNGTAILELTLYGGGVELRTIRAVAKNNSGDATARSDRPSATAVVIDDAWAAGDSNNRTYKVGMSLERVGANASGRVYPSKVTLTWGLR